MTQLDRLQIERHVDRVLHPYRGAPSPGMTIGVVQEGALVVHRSAGFASLELDVPIGPGTAFRIASVSKQFTCAAILLLVAEGRLAIEDDAATHLPELPDTGARVTVAHLMHNSSGVRDMLELMRQGGTDLGTPVTTANLLAAIGRQRALNFAPGSRYLYSNSNFLLLGLIVERITGVTLPDFLRTRIFDPLGMTMTRMTPSTAEVVPGLASGYVPAEAGGWKRAMHAFPLGGEGGLVSSVEDLALWAMNAETGRVGGAALTEALETTTNFTNGARLGYARGLQVGSYRGLRTVSHGGLWPGFKTQFMRIPERRLAVIVISNNGSADPYHAAQEVLDAMIDGTPDVHPVPPMPPLDVLAQYTGRWIDRTTGHTVDFALEHGRLNGRTWGVPFRMRAGEDGWLMASRASRDFLAKLGEDGATLEIEADAGIRSIFSRVPAEAALPADLPGRYESDEMAATWTVGPAEDATMPVHIDGPVVRGGAMRVLPVDGDFVRIVAQRALFDAWMDVRVLRRNDGSISGLHVDGGRVRNVVFARV